MEKEKSTATTTAISVGAMKRTPNPPSAISKAKKTAASFGRYTQREILRLTLNADLLL